MAKNSNHQIYMKSRAYNQKQSISKLVKNLGIDRVTAPHPTYPPSSNEPLPATPYFDAILNG